MLKSISEHHACKNTLLWQFGNATLTITHPNLSTMNLKNLSKNMLEKSACQVRVRAFLSGERWIMHAPITRIDHDLIFW